MAHPEAGAEDGLDLQQGLDFHLKIPDLLELLLNVDQIFDKICGTAHDCIVWTRLFPICIAIKGSARTDIDSEQLRVYINDPEKNSDARVLKVSQKLIGMFSMLRRMQKNPEEKQVWTATEGAIRSNFYRQRKRAAYKLQNQNLMKIHFHTFRHFKATMEYHKTRDILHVQRMLGHRSINSTMVYTQLIENTDGDDYHFSVAKNDVEAKPLVEKGFEYVATTPDGVMLFRKRK